MTGPAGAGKCELVFFFFLLVELVHCSDILSSAKLLEALLLYARKFSKNIGHEFTKNTIRVTAVTGAAATEIGGQTTCKELHLAKKGTHATDEEMQAFLDTRLCIIDEVSMGGIKDLLEPLNDKLGKFTSCQEMRYGKCALVFLGDFCQLPSFGDVIYEEENGILWEQAINCMVELEGTHRFKDCPHMERIVPGFRRHGLTPEDREILNSRVVNGTTVKMPDVLKTKFSSWTNVKRSSFNATVFKKYLERNHAGCTEHNIPRTAVVIKSNASWGKGGKNLTFNQRKILFEECPEGRCKSMGNKHCDPLLCLFSDCHLMGNENTDVANGVANGTTALFKKLHLKPGAKLTPIRMHGHWVYSVDIDEVESLELEWHQSKFMGRFRVKPCNVTCRVDFPVLMMGKKETLKVPIKLQCFPVVLNHATTGHKLQGKSMDQLVIVEWSKKDRAKWAYVVISRVRTLEGLFLLEPIPDDIDFAPDQKYLDMMDRMRSRVLASPEQIENLMEEYLHSSPHKNF